MSRLPTALLVTWLALLGAAVPACACAAIAPNPNCCPNDEPADCTNSDAAAAIRAAALCWSAAPAAVRSVFVAPGRAASERLADAGPSHFPIAPSLVIALAHSAASRNEPLAVASRADRDGSSIYLRTLRLRL